MLYMVCSCWIIELEETVCVCVFVDQIVDKYMLFLVLNFIGQ